MSLAEYLSKRSAKKTPEPKGGIPSNGGLRFVVQKHQAGRLHFDFRIELDGVLKSWAIPKGPSLDPSQRRLAVMVEDHPIDYRTFEGTIPEGAYGAGTVMVWDQGNYSDYGAEPGSRNSIEDRLRDGLEKGELKIFLNGKKLRGAFALVRIKGWRGGDNWLLIKKRDEFASHEDPLANDMSVLSGRSFDEIKAAGDEVTARPDLKLSGARIKKQPRFLEPMLATLADDPFDDPEWISEIKWDGYRVMAFVEGGEVGLRSRNNKDLTSLYEPVSEELAHLRIDCVLDGEVVVINSEGVSDFSAIQNYQRTGAGNLRYFVFDLPFADGYDLTNLPLLRRKEALQQIVKGLELVRLSDHVVGQAKELFQEAKDRNLEGIISKKSSSRYHPGKRTRSWLKFKTHERQEVVIGGFTEPRGGRKKLGALVAGVYEDGRLTYIGHVGGGLSNQQLEDLHNRLHPLERDSSPFSGTFKTNAPVHWVEPKLLCEVQFSAWTEDGLMRQPSFVGMRDDKDPREVVRELHRSMSDEKREPVRRSRVHFSNLDTVYWPHEGYTKGDLIGYYDSVSELIVPYLRHRPISLNRQPNGIDGPGFYQKNIENPPDWAKTVSIHSESGDRDINWLVCENRDTLLYMANLGCIEINPWLSRVSNLQRPDYCLIDIDAKSCRFDVVITVALELKGLLDELGLLGYPKTSGRTGMHVCIPLNAKYTYEQSRSFAELISQVIQQRLPKLTSIERDPSKRRNKVYLDYLQNCRGQTMAAPYCVRPVPGATVSTPISWDEVDSSLKPNLFTLKTALKRFDSVGDLWRPVHGKGIDMMAALKIFDDGREADRKTL